MLRHTTKRPLQNRNISKSKRQNTKIKTKLITKRRFSTTNQSSLSSQLTSDYIFHTPQRYELPSGYAHSTNELRTSFLNYFKSQGHEHLPSASVVPATDPTLLFTSAGMVPFKNIFLGIEQPPHGKTRLTTSQRCIRAGGKHNDLDNVGYTARHHTYFEMLGNFSFGDYFKEEAIYYAWDYLTNTLQMPKNKLMVSVFETDDEAAQLWAKISGFNENNGSIRRMGAADNFWQMGDTGPCGPCSEIYFDQGFEIDGEQFLEIWNLVFMQYNKLEDGTMIPLEKKCVDTGMGLERLAGVMQGVRNNYDNDTFLKLINTIGSTAHFHNLSQQTILTSNSSSSTTSPNIITNKNNNNTNTNIDLTTITQEQKLTATRVVTDHMRSILAMLYDGVQPGSTGRGYVLRRILRRACRYGLNLGYTAPFMYTHVEDVLQSMEHAIPGISQHTKQLRADLFREEKIFSSSLNKGMKIIKDYIDKQKLIDLHQSGNTTTTNNNNESQLQQSNNNNNDKIFPVDLAFTLYDAHGFPIDLTELCVKDYGYTLDTNAVEQLLLKRRIECRESSKTQLASLNSSTNNNGEQLLTQKLIDSMFDLWRGEGYRSEFVGYDKTFVPNTKILDIQPLNEMKRINHDNNNDTNENINYGKRQVMLTIEECPFYATGGGQTSDTGYITLRIPKPLLPPSAQIKSTHDFETITLNVTNAIKDNTGEMILLVADFDEHPFITSDQILELISNPIIHLNNMSENNNNNTNNNNNESQQQQPWHRVFVSASIDSDLRTQTSIHHTATHLLQAALQTVLSQTISEVGDHHEHHHHNDSTTTIKQAGSQVEHKNLRFDFGFARPLTQQEINAVEDRINAIALRRVPVNICEMTFDEAKSLGAMALFGEKYGSEVRVVSIPELYESPTSKSSLLSSTSKSTSPTTSTTTSHYTDNLPINTTVLSNREINKVKNFSIELCGGTHVSNTAECYPFVILSENGVSSGTRRIEAIAGPMASKYLSEQHRLLKILKNDNVLKIHHLSGTDEIISNVVKLKTKHDNLATRVKELEKDKLAILSGKNKKSSSSSTTTTTQLSNEPTQSINPRIKSFWYQPEGVELTVVAGNNPTCNDDEIMNSKCPIILLYNVNNGLSNDYSIYRKFTEDLFNQQSNQHSKFISTLQPQQDKSIDQQDQQNNPQQSLRPQSHLHQSILHVFIGEDNGKAIVYSNIPESMTKKGGDSTILSAHGNKPMTSNDLWKVIAARLPKSKGGGNMLLAQGTFDFSVIGGEPLECGNDIFSKSTTRMHGLELSLQTYLSSSMKIDM